MQSRRDQLHAYRFLTRRAVAALVTGQADVVEAPMRRLTVTTVSGTMVGVLLVAGFALLGLLKPSKDTSSWRTDGSVVVEKQTGARYVMLAGVLHPALNYSSALLAASGPGGVHVATVDRSSLAGTSRGPTIGIPGLPDSLPAASGLVRSPWTVCSTTAAGRIGTSTASVDVQVGSAVAAAALPPDAAVLVASPNGTQYLLWHGSRLRITSTSVAASLGIQNAAPVVVGSALLDALPEGAELSTPTIAGLGSPSRAVAGALVGQLVHTSDANSYFVALGDGIQQVDPIQTALLRTERIAGGYLNPLQVTEATVLGLNARPASAAAVLTQFDGLPETVPALSAAPAQNGALCVVFTDSGLRATFTSPTGTPPSPGDTVQQSAAGSSGVADAVTVANGAAALARSTDAATTFVVADPGKKFALVSSDAATALGYSGVAAVALPAQLLAIIPTGPALSPTAARKSASG